jgi:hypothetical protein
MQQYKEAYIAAGMPKHFLQGGTWASDHWYVATFHP